MCKISTDIVDWWCYFKQIAVAMVIFVTIITWGQKVQVIRYLRVSNNRRVTIEESEPIKLQVKLGACAILRTT